MKKLMRNKFIDTTCAKMCRQRNIWSFYSTVIQFHSWT